MLWRIHSKIATTEKLKEDTRRWFSLLFFFFFKSQKTSLLFSQEPAGPPRLTYTMPKVNFCPFIQFDVNLILNDFLNLIHFWFLIRFLDFDPFYDYGPFLDYDPIWILIHLLDYDSFFALRSIFWIVIHFLIFSILGFWSTLELWSIFKDGFNTLLQQFSRFTVNFLYILNFHPFSWIFFFFRQTEFLTRYELMDIVYIFRIIIKIKQSIFLFLCLNLLYFKFIR